MESGDPRKPLTENPENAAVKAGAVEIRTAHALWAPSGEARAIGLNMRGGARAGRGPASDRSEFCRHDQGSVT